MDTEAKKQRRPKRDFSPEFKAGAVRLVVEEGKLVAQVARDLDISHSTVGKWVEQARADAGKSTKGSLTTEERAELASLRKRVRELEIERSILKKAAAFFAREGVTR